MISVLFQTETHYPVNRKKIKQSIVAALEPQVKRDTEVSISIVGDRRMKQLNQRYRNVDATTDVLSFPLNESTVQDAPFIEPPDGILRLGDVIVSYPQAVVQASEENVLVDDKIISLTLHGLNHLMGIHHAE